MRFHLTAHLDVYRKVLNYAAAWADECASATDGTGPCESRCGHTFAELAAGWMNQIWDEYPLSQRKVCRLHLPRRSVFVEIDRHAETLSPPPPLSFFVSHTLFSLQWWS